MAGKLKLGTIVKPRTVRPLVGQASPLEHEVNAMMERLSAVEMMCNEESYTDALELATKCLQTAEALYGPDDTRLAYPYIMVGKSNAGLGRLKKAEKLLSLANFIVIKNDMATAEAKSRLFRAIGWVYHLKGTTQEALRVYADDVYHASEAFGPEHCRTAGGYCGLAAVFSSKETADAKTTATVLYTKVAQIWYTALLACLGSDVGSPTDLSDVQKSDAQCQLLEAMQYFGSEESPNALQEGVCCASLGMLCSISPNQEQLAHQFLDRALTLLPDDHAAKDGAQKLQSLLRSKEGAE